MRREIVKVPVPDDERRCCDAEKRLIGTRVRLTIEYRPGEAFVREERAEVRARKICESSVVTAPITPAPIESARPGPSMLESGPPRRSNAAALRAEPSDDVGP
jgi:hypothetical protein